MRALSIRQPWAELILRGVKTVEYRSRPALRSRRQRVRGGWHRRAAWIAEIQLGKRGVGAELEARRSQERGSGFTIATD